MDASDSDGNRNFEELFSLSDLEPNDVDELLNLLKLRTAFYQEETAKMESAFVKLQLVDERSNLFEDGVELIEKLSQLQDKFSLKELTPNALALSYADKLKKHNYYCAKLKVCLKMYIELNETITKKIKHLKSLYEEAQQRIDTIVTSTMEEIQTMEKKISRYEHELSKLEKKYPWLKDSEYNLPNISKEINLLIAARQEKEALLKELECYGGLKPDMQEASQQLEQIKREFDVINKKLLEK